MQYFFFSIHTNNFLGVFIHILIYIIIKTYLSPRPPSNWEEVFFFKLLENFMSFKMCQTQQIKRIRSALYTHWNWTQVLRVKFKKSLEVNFMMMLMMMMNSAMNRIWSALNLFANHSVVSHTATFRCALIYLLFKSLFFIRKFRLKKFAVALISFF